MTANVRNIHLIGPVIGSTALKILGKMGNRYVTHFSIRKLILGAALSSVSLTYADIKTTSKSKMHNAAARIFCIAPAFFLAGAAFHCFPSIAQWTWKEGVQIAIFTALPSLLFASKKLKTFEDFCRGATKEQAKKAFNNQSEASLRAIAKQYPNSVDPFKGVTGNDGCDLSNELKTSFIDSIRRLDLENDEQLGAYTKPAFENFCREATEQQARNAFEHQKEQELKAVASRYPDASNPFAGVKNTSGNLLAQLLRQSFLDRIKELHLDNDPDLGKYVIAD